MYSLGPLDISACARREGRGYFQRFGGLECRVVGENAPLADPADRFSGRAEELVIELLPLGAGLGPSGVGGVASQVIAGDASPLFDQLFERVERLGAQEDVGRHGQQVVALDDAQLEQLRAVLADMHQISHSTRTAEHEEEIITTDEDGNDRMKDTVQANYRRIKEEVKQIVQDELERIAGDDNLKHLLQ